MKIKPVAAPVATLVLAVIVIVGAQALGYWNDAGKDKAPKATAEGTYRVDDIKGSFTLSQIEEYYGVPVAALAEAFEVPAESAANFQSKTLAEAYAGAAHAVNNDTIKVFVAFYAGTSVDLGDGSVFLPQTAADVILREGAPTDAQRTYLDSHTFDATIRAADEPVTTSGTAKSGGDGTGTGAGTGTGTGTGSGTAAAQSATSIELTGSSTFVDVAGSYGIPAQDLMAAFGLSPEQYAFFAMKDLKTLYADSAQPIGAGSVKLFVALYAGSGYDLSVAETYLPRSAADVLTAHGGLTDTQRAYLDAHVV